MNTHWINGHGLINVTFIFTGHQLNIYSLIALNSLAFAFGVGAAVFAPIVPLVTLRRVPFCADSFLEGPRAHRSPPILSQIMKIIGNVFKLF
jgi:hypothetical protein